MTPGMGARAILRLVYKRVEGPEVERVAPPLSRALGSGEEYTVEVYNVRLDSLIIQDPEGPDATRYSGAITLAGRPWRSYCRWHDGPLDRRDEPWKRLYCTVEARDYCRYHRRSLRALYDICLTMRGPQGLEACRRLDEEVSGEYTLYLTHTGKGVKVGVTRSFRILDRMAEQPHSLATVLAVYDSLYRARRAEMAVSRSGLAREASVRRPRRPDPAAAAPALSQAAREAARLLGVDWSGSLLRVRPPRGLLEAPLVDPSRAAGGLLEPASYWGGLLLLHSTAGDIVLRVRDLLHRDSVVMP